MAFMRSLMSEPERVNANAQGLHEQNQWLLHENPSGPKIHPPELQCVCTMQRKIGNRRFQFWASANFFLCLASFLVLLKILFRQQSTTEPPTQAWGTYETGWRETELHSAFPVIGLEKVRFQQYDIPDDVSNFIPPPSDYTGEPTKEIDAAWEELIARKSS
ncbi:hypothetical protein LZ30DRAFT_811496 [Colletotrichum cereale]|nr:hypothetical protein LZ30DRAFT_811496 [Colletotrichum cereale]